MSDNICLHFPFEPFYEDVKRALKERNIEWNRVDHWNVFPLPHIKWKVTVILLPHPTRKACDVQVGDKLKVGGGLFHVLNFVIGKREAQLVGWMEPKPDDNLFIDSAVVVKSCAPSFKVIEWRLYKTDDEFELAE